jgi:hypothetical protein
MIFSQSNVRQTRKLTPATVISGTDKTDQKYIAELSDTNNKGCLTRDSL